MFARGTATDEKRWKSVMIIHKTIYEDTELFRIMPLERFIQLLSTNSNVLVRPSMWEDPYERVVAKSVMFIDGKNIPFDETRWYGQCWTRNPESDALWRIFTNGKNIRAVMIKSTSDIIMQSLYRVEKSSKRVYFLENVEYPEESENEKETLAKTYHFEWMWEHGYNIKFENLGLEDNNIAAAPVLLTKRHAFEHEKEVRLLCYWKKKQPKKQTVYSYKIPSLVSFLKDEVIVDPWAPEGFDDALKETIDKFLPTNNLSVRKSNLYKEWDKGFQFRPNL